MATCRKNESSAIDPLAVVHNRQATGDEDGVSFLRQKRIELLQRREQEQKQQRTILQPDSQHNVTSAAGDTTSVTASRFTDASLSSFVSCAPPKLPTNPAPLTASSIFAPVTTTITSTPTTLTPFAPLPGENNSPTPVFLSPPNGFLSDAHPASAAPVTVLPCHPFGTSPTCLATRTPSNCLAAGLTSVPAPLASATPYVPVTPVSTPVPVTSSSHPIISLITELETLLLPNPEVASSCANSIRQSRNLASGNRLDSFFHLHDVNSNKDESEKFSDVTRSSGQNLIPKESLQLEPFHSSSIPQFYFPAGCSSEPAMFTDVLPSQVVKVFEKVDGKAKAEHMGLIAKVRKSVSNYHGTMLASC